MWYVSISPALFYYYSVFTNQNYITGDIVISNLRYEAIYNAYKQTYTHSVHIANLTILNSQQQPKKKFQSWFIMK